VSQFQAMVGVLSALFGTTNHVAVTAAFGTGSPKKSPEPREVAELLRFRWRAEPTMGDCSIATS
jgi:hypothetical protein